MLDFETENGERRQIPTGTARGKPADAGIVEIRMVEEHARGEEITEAEAIEPISSAPRKSLLDELREQAKTSLSVPDIEEREVNLPSSFGADWSGLIASYKNLMDTCEMKEIAQEMLNTPATLRDFDKIKGFVAVISSLMKSLADTEQWI